MLLADSLLFWDSISLVRNTVFLISWGGVGVRDSKGVFVRGCLLSRHFSHRDTDLVKRGRLLALLYPLVSLSLYIALLASPGGRFRLS